MKNLVILLFNDLHYSIKNKGFYLILFLPFFIMTSEKLLDKNNSEVRRLNVAVLSNGGTSEKIVTALKNHPEVIRLIWIESLDIGRRYVSQRQVEGFLNDDELIVNRKESPQSLALLQLFSNLQRTTEGGGPSWITSVQPLQVMTLSQQTLPTWILMLVLLVAFIILPVQVAEEKEKKLVFALLQTPINEIQWLGSKVILGVLLSLISVGLLHLCSGFLPIHYGWYCAFLVLGSLSFNAVGLFLGFLCRHQSSARTLGFIFYLPLLLPSALADFSQKLMGVAPWVPSFQFYNPLQILLFEADSSELKMFPWLYLLCLGVLFFTLSYVLIKKRWLMA